MTTIHYTPVGGSQVRIGKLYSVGKIMPTSDALDVTPLDAPDNCRSYVQGFRDSGRITIDGFFSPSDDGQSALRSAYASGSIGNFRITFPDSSSAAFAAFVQSYSVGSADIDGFAEFSAVLRVSGGITFTQPTPSASQGE